MAQNIYSLQLLRSNQVYATKEAAVNALNAFSGTSTPSNLDGVAALARYTDGDGKVKSVVGFGYESGGTRSMTIMDFDSTQIAAMQTEINSIESGVGLSNTGEYVPTTGANYTDSATTVVGAIDALDDAIKANADDIAEINSAITAMDADSVSGESKVVIDVTQQDGKVTASAANLTGVKLDGYTEAAAVADVAATDTLGEALGKLQKTIHEMDLAAVGTEGSIITSVSEADGKVSATATPLVDVTLAGFQPSTAETGDLAATDDVKLALNKLQNKIIASQAATTVASSDNSINVETAVTGTNITVNIKSGEKVLAKDGGNGLYTDLDLVKITTGLPETVKERYQLLATDDSQIGVNIDIPKDSHIVSITYDGATQKLTYNYIDASGETQSTDIDMSQLVLETEFGSGVTVTDHIAHGVVDPTSERFLTVGAGGFKVSGVTDAITAAIEALNVTGDTAVAGQYVAAIEETDGVVSVKERANVSDAVLNGYAKGEKPASTAIAATDDVKGAIAKLEHQIDDAKAAATTKVEKEAAANHLTLTSSTAADGSVTYTIGESDIASATALTQEISDRTAGDNALDARLGTGVTSSNTATEQFAALSGTTGDTSGTTSIEGAKRYADEIAAGAVADLDATVTHDGTHIDITIEEVDGKLVQSGFTVTETDIASAAALTAEIAARKAVDGVYGDAYTADTTANYISGATSLYGADQALDAALKVVADKVDSMTSGAVQTVKVNTVPLTEDANGAVNVAIAAVNSAANSENAIVVTTADANADNPGAVTLQLGTLDAGTFD